MNTSDYALLPVVYDAYWSVGTKVTMALVGEVGL